MIAQVRKHKNLNPINLLHDLYRMDKEGQTENQLDNKGRVDDIVLATDEVFVDLSSDF